MAASMSWSETDPRLLDRALYVFRSEEKVCWGNVDRSSHVNNLAVSTYCENSRVEHREALMTRAGTGTRVPIHDRTACCSGHGSFGGGGCVDTVIAANVCIVSAAVCSPPLPDTLRENTE